MNDSEQIDTFLTTCKVAKTSFVVPSQFPNEKYERHQIAVLVVNCILLFSTISLNGIAVITVRKSSQLRSKICYFVILLQSVADLGVGVVGISIFIYYLLFPFLDNGDCTFVILALRTALLSCGLSAVTLSAMTMERYIGVLHPYYYQTKVTKKRILICVCGSGLALFSALAYSFHNDRIARIFITGSAVVFFFFTGFVYTRIYLVIRKLIRSERRPACESDGNEDIKKRQMIRESRHARSCFLIVICFALFLLPLSLAPVLFADGSYDFIMYRNWSSTLIFLNSSINSVIFFWTKTLFRKEAIKILKSLCSQPS